LSSPVKTVDAPCAHCGEYQHETLWSGSEHEYDNTTDESFAFVRCSSCGTVRLNPRPDVSELGSPPGFAQRIKIRMYQRRLLALLDRLGKEGTIRLLDVGCADGRLLNWYKDSSAGDRIETHGIELSEKAADAARSHGHRVVTGRFEVDRELEPGSFDLILAYHVIEHVDDPVAFATRAAELLVPGGLFVAATPNIDSVDVKRFRAHWGGNHFPRHWTLYDPETIERLARQIGLRVERIEYQTNPIFWVWTCHSWLRGRFPERRWPDRAFPTVGIFHASPLSFVLLSIFTTVDIVLRAITGKTGSMAAEMRKPPTAGSAPP